MGASVVSTPRVQGDLPHNWQARLLPGPPMIAPARSLRSATGRAGRRGRAGTRSALGRGDATHGRDVPAAMRPGVRRSGCGVRRLDHARSGHDAGGRGRLRVSRGHRTPGAITPAAAATGGRGARRAVSRTRLCWSASTRCTCCSRVSRGKVHGSVGEGISHYRVPGRSTRGHRVGHANRSRVALRPAPAQPSA